MKRAALALVSLAIATPVFAENAPVWKAFGNAGQSRIYLDAANIKRGKDTVSLWVLYDFDDKQPALTGKTFNSLLTQASIDCPKQMSKILFAGRYSEHMGKGEALDVEKTKPNQKPEPIDPGTVMQAIANQVCKAKE